MDGNRDQNISIEKELSPEYNRIVEKWKGVIDFNNPLPPLSARKVTVILIESQERWHTPEEVKAATPNFEA